MSITKHAVLSTIAGSAVLFSSIASAELSGNIGATSDYLWRGTTQTDHGAATFGGLDYGHSSGLYAGTWVANVSSDTEIDVYAGFAGEAAGLSYDIGYIHYHYPNNAEDFGEGYISLGYSLVSVGYYMDFDNENSYVSGAIDYELKEGLSIGLNAGATMNDDSDSDYVHFGASMTKSIDGGWDFTFAVSDTDQEEGSPNENPVATITLAKEFDI